MRGYRNKRSTPAFIRFLVTIIALAVVSFAIALVWQNTEDAITGKKTGNKNNTSGPESENSPVMVFDSDIEPEGSEMSFDEDIPLEESSEESLDEEEGSSEEDDSSDESGDSSSEEGEDGLSQNFARAAVSGAIPASPSVDYSYFNDAIFFGDSISTGIPLYMKSMVPDTAVIATQGVSPEGANSSQCIDVGGSKVTMLEAAKLKGERKKVYVMLGANALDLDEKSLVDGYEKFVKSLKQFYPDAKIYVQSILPVTTRVNYVYPSKNINNERIAAYNTAICAMAAAQGVYYVDVAQCMVDAAGALPVEASPNDGIHLNPEYYFKWFDYLRTHTAPDIKN